MQILLCSDILKFICIFLYLCICVLMNAHVYMFICLLTQIVISKKMKYNLFSVGLRAHATRSVFWGTLWPAPARTQGQKLKFSYWLRTLIQSCIHRRKFRSQSSDNMDRWKAEMGRVREKSRREKSRREKIREEKESEERRRRCAKR